MSAIFALVLFSFFFVLFFVFRSIRAPAVAAAKLFRSFNVSDYFLRGFSSYHTREWIAIILIAFKFLDLKALCVRALQLLCRFAISYNIFLCQRFVSCSSRVHSGPAHERAKRSFFYFFFHAALSHYLFAWYFTSMFFSYTFNSRLVED